MHELVRNENNIEYVKKEKREITMNVMSVIPEFRRWTHRGTVLSVTVFD